MIFDVGYFMAWPRVVALCGLLSVGAFGLYSLFEIPKPSQAQAWPAGEDARQRAVPAEPTPEFPRQQSTRPGISTAVDPVRDDLATVAVLTGYGGSGFIPRSVERPSISALDPEGTQPQDFPGPPGVDEPLSPTYLPPSPQAFLAWRDGASETSREVVAAILRLHADRARDRIADATDLEHPDARIVEEIMADMHADVAADLEVALTDDELDALQWAPSGQADSQTVPGMAARFAPRRSSSEPMPFYSLPGYGPEAKRAQVEMILERRAAIARQRLVAETDRENFDSLTAEQIMADTHANIVDELKEVVTEDELRAMLWLPADTDVLSTRRE